MAAGKGESAVVAGISAQAGQSATAKGLKTAGGAEALRVGGINLVLNVRRDQGKKDIGERRDRRSHC